MQSTHEMSLIFPIYEKKKKKPQTGESSTSMIFSKNKGCCEASHSTGQNFIFARAAHLHNKDYSHRNKQ